MTKIRGGRAIIEDLKLVRDTVRTAGHDNTDYATNVQLTEDTGRDLLRAARALDALIELLEPMLERRDRAGARSLDDLIERIVALERWRADMERERREQRTMPRLPIERG